MPQDQRAKSLGIWATVYRGRTQGVEVLPRGWLGQADSLVAPLLRRSELDGARRIASAAKIHAPGDPDALLAVARVLAASGEVIKAIAQLEDIWRTHPDITARV